MPAGRPAEERRQHRTERAAKWKAAVAESMDLGRGWTGPGRGRDPFDAGVELATKQATAAREAGRPLRPSERREVRREVLAQQAGTKPAGQARRPTIDEYLESLSERQRDEIEQSDWFQNLDERHRADVRRRVDALAQVEEEAEYEFQI